MVKKKATIQPPSKTTADDFFKASMKDLNIAHDFFKFNLPTKIRESIDLETLDHAPSEYLNIALRRRLADMVYSVKCHKASDESSLLFLHIEQQSTPRRLMPLRMLELLISILKEYTQRKDPNGTKPLPVVIPIILSNHNKVYPYSTRFLDLFTEIHRDWMHQVLTEPLQVVDLAVLPDSNIKSHSRAGMMEWALKHVSSSSLKKVINECVVMLKDLIQNQQISEDQAGQYFETLLYYLADNVTDLPSEVEIDNIISTAQSQLPAKTGELMPTLREHYEHRGEVRGEVRGEKRGEKRGIQRVALNLVHRGMPEKFVAETTGLSVNAVKRLKDSERSGEVVD